MKSKQRYISILIVALSLGTAWAVRGKFGHEQGAAWAGGIGTLALVLVGKRKDWYNKVFKVTLAGAVGWGISGAMSYGLVVGYGRGLDFINVFYGLSMLFIIGILYGFIGGGMVGLALVDSNKFKVSWHYLIMEMVVWGMLTYGLLIHQLEWLMTPPRSELWASCLGASIALAWHVVRNKWYHVLKVAVWSALGAGFGFSFGNFVQTLGTSTQLHFNFWNVMEYSIGFFGGLGMAGGVLTTTWPELEKTQTKLSNLVPLLLLVLLIPFVVWQQADWMNFSGSDGHSTLSMAGKWLALITILGMAAFILHRYYLKAKVSFKKNGFNEVNRLLLVYLGVYIGLSFLITRTGTFTFPLEQYLYLVNIGAIVYLHSRVKGELDIINETPYHWLLGIAIMVLTIALMAAISIISHGEMPGAQIRFNV